MPILDLASATPGRVASLGARPNASLDEPIAVEEKDEEDEDSWALLQEESWGGYQLEACPAYPVASYDEEDDPELLPAKEQDYEKFELDEPEAIALNSIKELDDTADAGHAIQLQLAAHAAFGKAEGKA